MGRALLMQLVDAGLTVSRDGDHLIVAPRDRLTDELRATIRQRKEELLAALNQTLDERIGKMAKRWGYTANELREALTGVRSDPQGWMAWTERDERDFGNCVTPEDFATRYARLRALT